MKSFIRSASINGLSLFAIGQGLEGVVVTGGLRTYVLGGIILSILSVTLKPLFGLISLPLNMVTLGMFSFFSNAILLYILTILVTEIKISAFTFPGYSTAGFIIPEIHFNSLFAYVISASVLSLVQGFINWVIKR